MEMKRDLAVQAGTTLRDVIGDGLTEQQHAAVERWLTAQLEAERSGWKQKLTMAMREIEKERKQALDVHMAIHKINETIEAHQLVTGSVHREPSMYMNAEKDMKVSHIVALEKNVNAMLELIEKAARRPTERPTEAVDERPDGADPERRYDGMTPDEMAEEIERLRRLVERGRREAEEREERLTKEIALLSDTIRLQEAVLRDVRQANEREVVELTAEVSRLRSEREAVRTRDRPPDGAAGRRDKAIGVCMKIQVRECCIQTDRDLEDLADGADPSTRSGGDPSDLGPPDSHRLKPLIEVTISDSDRRTTSNNLAADRGRRGPSLEAGVGARKGVADADNAKVLDRVSSLRHRVVTFAQKLEDARWKMDEYQRQMSLIRTNPRCRRRRPPPGDATEPTNDGGLNRKWKSSDGYLCGIRKDIVDSPRSNWGGCDPTSRDSKRTKRDRNVCGTTNTCFRCHKVYRLKENHRMACRYHPKGKQSIERYDNTGKLIRIIQVWECCMQQNDAVGCSVGEHI